MGDTIFAKIIKGEIPAYKIYEDAKTLAFLDIHPVQAGMVLVVTKETYETFLDLPPDELNALMATVQRVGKRLQQIFPDKKRIGVQIEGLDVPHVHVKVFPIDSGSEFRAAPDMNAEPDHTALAALAKKLAF